MEKLGREKVFYSRVDEHHFSVNAPIEISDQFFGWICGLGKAVRILAPAEVVEEMGEYVKGIADMY